MIPEAARATRKYVIHSHETGLWRVVLCGGPEDQGSAFESNSWDDAQDVCDTMNLVAVLVAMAESVSDLLPLPERAPFTKRR